MTYEHNFCLVKLKKLETMIRFSYWVNRELVDYELQVNYAKLVGSK